jgi:YHS domain-containing protein
MAKDPVCGMEVDEKTAVKLEKDGEVYYFCSTSDRDAFLARTKPKAAEKEQRQH